MTCALQPKALLLARLRPTHRQMVDYLTDRQAVLALRFMDAPDLVPLPPMALDVLTALLIDRWGTEEYEREIGVPVRSARPLLAQALDTYEALEAGRLAEGRKTRPRSVLDEIRASDLPRDEVIEELSARIEWLVGDGGDAIDVIAAYGLTRQQAPIILALQRANGRVVSYDSLLARINVLRPDADMSSVLSLQTQVSYMRRKLRAAGVPHEIENVYGVGYRMVSGSGASQS